MLSLDRDAVQHYSLSPVIYPRLPAGAPRQPPHQARRLPGRGRQLRLQHLQPHGLHANVLQSCEQHPRQHKQQSEQQQQQRFPSLLWIHQHQPADERGDTVREHHDHDYCPAGRYKQIRKQFLTAKKSSFFVCFLGSYMSIKEKNQVFINFFVKKQLKLIYFFNCLFIIF